MLTEVMTFVHSNDYFSFDRIFYENMWNRKKIEMSQRRFHVIFMFLDCVSLTNAQLPQARTVFFCYSTAGYIGNDAKFNSKYYQPT